MANYNRGVNITFNTKVNGLSAINNLAQKTQQIANQTKKMATNGFEKMMTPMAKLDNLADGVSRSFKSMGDNGSNSMNRFRASISSVASGIYVFKNLASAVKEVCDASDRMIMIQSRMKLMNDGLMSTDQLTNSIYQASERSRGSFSSTADMVAKLGLLAGDAFKNNQEIVDFAEQLNKQMKIAGTDTIQAKSAMLQLTQALGSGRLQGDELRSIMETMPTIIQSIADELNVPKGKVKELASEGKITAEVLKNAVLNSADTINKKFETVPQTFGTVMQSIQNKIQMGFMQTAHIFGNIFSSERMQSLVSGISTVISTVMGIIGSIALGMWTAFTIVGDVISNIFTVIAPVFNSIASMLGIANVSGQSFAQTLYTIAYVVGILIGMWLMYKAVMLIVNVVSALFSIITSGGISLVILSIMLLVTAIAFVVASIFGMGSSFAEVCAGMAGGFAVVGAIISMITQIFVASVVNQVIWLLNIIITVINVIGNVVVSCINFLMRIFAIFTADNLSLWDKIQMVGREAMAMVLDAAGAMANGAGAIIGNVINKIIDMANKGADVLNGLIKHANKLPGINIPLIGHMDKIGTNWGDGMQNYAGKLRAKNDSILKSSGNDVPKAYEWKDIKPLKEMKPKMQNLGDVYNNKYNEVLGWFKKTDSKGNKEKPNKFPTGNKGGGGYPLGGGGIPSGSAGKGGIGKSPGVGSASPIGKIAQDTGAIKNSVATTEEDLKYLLDVAKKDAINRYGMTEVNINMTNNNNVAKDVDLDGMVDHLNKKLEETLLTQAEEVHY